MEIGIMRCTNCSAGKPCPPPGGIHLHTMHLVSLDPIVCACGSVGRRDGTGFVFTRNVRP